MSERKKLRERDKKEEGLREGGEQEDGEQILSHGEVGGRNMEWWESQKKVRKMVGGIGGETGRRGRNTERESSTHNKTTNRRDRMRECSNK